MTATPTPLRELLQQIADEPSDPPFNSAQNRQIERMRQRAMEAIAALSARAAGADGWGPSYQQPWQAQANATPPASGEAGAVGVGKDCCWPEGARFTVRDEPGEHDPCWLILPGGEMLALNHYAINGVDQARAHFIANACNSALFGHRPSDDELWEQTLRERDHYHEVADDLANAIANHLGCNIGEHSSMNDPWQNALDAIEEARPYDATPPATSGDDEVLICALTGLASHLRAVPAYRNLRGDADVIDKAVRRLAAVAPAGMDGVVREEVDREVRGGRIFYFRHNPPNTMLAQIFNNILLANGTYEADNAKHQSRENAARAQLGVLATAPTPPATAGQE